MLVVLWLTIGGQGNVPGGRHGGPSVGVATAPAKHPPAPAAEAPLPGAGEALVVPSDRPASHVPTVMHGNEGVVFHRDPKTGTTELIVDPFPDEGKGKGGKRGRPRERREGVDTSPTGQ